MKLWKHHFDKWALKRLSTVLFEQTETRKRIDAFSVESTVNENVEEITKVGQIASEKLNSIENESQEGIDQNLDDIASHFGAD